MADSYDVVVAGGGLVGAAFAAGVASTPGLSGLRIAVVDRHFHPPEITLDGNRPEDCFDPRVVALTEASRLLLESAGIWSSDVAERACPYHHMEVRDGQGTGFIEFDCYDVHRDNLGHIVENSVIVGAAHRVLEKQHNVDLIKGGISGLTSAEGVSLRLDNGNVLSAPLLVAADGANSYIRSQAGFRLRSWDYGHTAIVATISTEKPHGLTACQWFGASGPLAFLPLKNRTSLYSETPDDSEEPVDRQESGGNYCSIVWSQEPGVSDEILALGDDDFCEALTRASESKLGRILGVSRRFSFPLRQRHAADYVQPGIVLVGDAAHTIHPLAGQGVNLGFGDVGVLIEELVRGQAKGLPVGHPSVLERYQRRRKPDNLAMMVAMEGFKRLFAGTDPVLKVLRNQGMSKLNQLAPVKNQLIRKAMGF